MRRTGGPGNRMDWWTLALAVGTIVLLLAVRGVL